MKIGLIDVDGHNYPISKPGPDEVVRMAQVPGRHRGVVVGLGAV